MAKSIEDRFDLYNSIVECADAAVSIFQTQKWRWFMVGIPTRLDILRTLAQLREYASDSEYAESGRLVYYKGQYGHEKRRES